MKIRSTSVIVAVAIALAAWSWGLAQGNQEQGGQRQRAGRQEAASATANQPFDPHDFNGIWRLQQGRGRGAGQRPDPVPPMTPWAQALFDAAKPGLDSAGGKAQPLGNDPIMTCEPVGYPRIAGYGAYPVELLQTKDKIVEFFDFFYTHRTIWLDGRSLPNDPEPTWYGYSVGHWDGDTLVVESNGFNGRAWLDNNGHPYSDEATLEERYKRVDHDHIQVTITLTDPKAYTHPWLVSVLTFRWSPQEVMREDLCAPSDEKRYLDEVREPAGSKN